MEKVYADLIIKGIKTISNVPEKIKNDVKMVLVERGYTELAEGDN